MTVLDEVGQVVEQRKVGTERWTLLDYLGKIVEPAALAVEATFNGYYFLELVEPLGLELHVVHPRKTKAIARARSTGVPPVKRSTPRPRWPCYGITRAAETPSWPAIFPRPLPAPRAEACASPRIMERWLQSRCL